jgi:hypothetical protein
MVAGDMASYTTYGAFDRTIQGLGTEISNVVGHVVFAGASGRGELAALGREVRATADAQRLADHQRSELAQCVASRLLTYAHNAVSRAFGVDAALSSHEGLCTEFSSIATELLRAAGLNAGIQMGYQHLPGGKLQGHAWNWVSIEGVTYWIDPQQDPIAVNAIGAAPFFNRQDGHVPKPAPVSPGGGAASGQACKLQGVTCAADADCCGGSCVATATGRSCGVACGSAGEIAACVPSAAACASIGGAARQVSCKGAYEGPTCCTLPSAR